MINYDRRFIEQIKPSESDWKKKERISFKKTALWLMILLGIVIIFGV